MKNILLTFLFITNSLLAIPNLPFKIERLNTDFSGVVYFNNTIFAYGNYGVILSSKDFGKNWKQYYIDEDSDIKKIIEINGRLIGIAGSNIIEYDKFKDKWNIKLNKDSIKYIDIAYANNQIFVISDNKIFTYDMNISLINEDFIKINKIFKSIEINNNDLNIILSDLKLIKYDINNSNIRDSINLSEKIIYSNIDTLDFKIVDNEFYLGLNTGIYKSTDSGLNWNKVDNYSTYNIYNKILYEIVSLNKNENPSVIIFNKIENKLKTNLNKNYINKDSTRLILSYDFKEICFVSKDTLISVGSDKLISISFDGGKNWEVISYLNSYNAQNNNQLQIVNDSLIYAIHPNFCINKSSNGGLTWLPQYYNYHNTNYYNIFNAYYQQSQVKGNSYFDNKGNGISVLSNGVIVTGKDTINYMKTHDYGNTYEYGFDKRFDYGFGLVGNNFIKLDTSLILLASHYDPYDTSKTNPYYTRFSKFDYNLNFTYKKQIYQKRILKMIYDENQNPYVLLKDNSGVSLCEFDYSIDTFKILYKNLEFLDNNKMSTIQLIQNNNEKYLLYIIDSTSGGTTYNPTTQEIKRIKSVIIDSMFIYNLSTRKNILSLITTDTLSYLGKGTLFKMDNIYYQGVSDGLLVNKNFLEGSTNWEKIKFPNYFFGEKYKSQKYTYCVTSNKPYTMKVYGGVFKFSSFNDNTNIESQTEDQTYFYSYPPFPIPARNELKSLIYWDMSYNIDDSDIGVYDIYGNKVADKDKISINKLNAYSGYLTWDCSGIGTGVYMIQIKHGNSTHNIRAMVVR